MAARKKKPRVVAVSTEARQWPAEKIERRPIGELLAYPQNPMLHSDEQVQQIAKSITEYGWTIPVLVDEAGVLIAGHARVRAAQLLGITEVPTMVARGWTAEQKKSYRIFDNQAPRLADWNVDLLRIELNDLKLSNYPLELTGFDNLQLVQFMAGVPTGKDHEATPEPPAKPVSRKGDLWLLGEHRLLCGDATNAEDVERLLSGTSIDLILMDPPYCSGGFQESNKAIGSVGTSAPHKQIANDRLSSRGYQSLLKMAISNIGAPYLYAFTDWRMWLWLFDVAESSGYGVRSMIVWDKGTPGMGKGWRSQHELIMWASKDVAPFEYKDGIGNVLQCDRTGNLHHTTEKPIEIIGKLLDVAAFARTVMDPFNGSGTTLLGCEKALRRGFGMELDPAYCDVAMLRWQEMTGKTARHADTGLTYAEESAARTKPARKQKRARRAA
jgi:DNA modification methylase